MRAYTGLLKPSGRRCRTAEIMELSVVIVSYNVKSYLGQALRSVIDAAVNIKSEVIVVDNGSTDGSPEMVAESFPKVKLIRSSSNRGYASACNTGIDASTGEYILILNPDTIVSPDALNTTLHFMNDHPEAGAAGARMADGNGRFLPESKRAFPSPLTSFFRLSGLSYLFKSSPVINRYYLGHIPENKNCRADILTGAFMFIKRKALDKAGLFDTAFFMYGEDIDLSWRIIQSGYINYYLAEAQIIHFKGKSAGHNNPECIRHFYNAMIIFSKKYFSGALLPFIVVSVKTRMYIALLLAHTRRLLVKS
jgi:GT2 family glycosyltransferase